MPQICTFFGILIYMYPRDHNPPHFHAKYGEFEAMISINNFSVIKGYLPPRALALVIEWTAIHTNELNENWQRMLDQQPFIILEPLK